jgi:hypothetical protein
MHALPSIYLYLRAFTFTVAFHHELTIIMLDDDVSQIQSYAGTFEIVSQSVGTSMEQTQKVFQFLRIYANTIIADTNFEF